MPAYLDTLGSIPRAIAAVVLLMAAAWGAGGWLIPTVAITRRRQWENDLLRMVVGLNLVGLAGVVLGMTGALAAGRSVWLLIAAALLGFNSLDRVRNLSIAKLWHRPAFSEALFAMMTVVTLGPALCYPTGWDEMVYHSVLPRRWLAEGFPTVDRDLPYSGFPSLGEILFWLIAPMEALIAARLVIWVGWILGLLLLICLLRRSGAGPSSTLLATAWALSPAVLLISANCYVESLLMMNVVALLLAASRFRHRRGAVLLGVLAGGSAAIKLTGLAVIALPVVLACSAGRLPRSQWRFCGTAVLIALAVCAPFYLRPWLATGNPCYPYLAEWFSTSPATLSMSRFHHAIGDVGFGVRSPETFVVAPILLALQDQLYDGGLGWQWLLFVMLSGVALWKVLRGESRTPVIGRLAVAFVLYVAWFVTSQQGRFAVPLAIAVVSAAGASFRHRSATARQVLWLTLIGTTLISLPWRTAGYYAASWETVFGRWSWGESLDDATQGKYLGMLAALDQTPADARILMLFEHRLLYVPRPAQIATPYFQERWCMPPEDFATAEAFLTQLTRNGITHVVLAKSPVGPDWSPEFWEKSQPVLRGIEAALQKKQLRVVWEAEHHLLLEIPAVPSN